MSRCPVIAVLAATAVGWPASVAVAQSADVDGDGRPDTVALAAATNPDGGSGAVTLRVTTASGARLAAPVSDGLPPPPRILRVANVDGRPGAEIFVDTAHISTMDTVGVYTYRRGRLARAGSFLVFGGDFDFKFGITCSRAGTAELLIQHEFTRNPGHGWTRSDKTYVWRAGSLVRRGHTRTTRQAGAPRRSQTGVAC